MTLRIHPRAKDIGPGYSGCQVMFGPTRDGWVVVMLVEVVAGDPVRVWSPHEPNHPMAACRFRRGEVVEGDPQECPMPEFLLLKSLAPGCFEKMRALKGTAAGFPPGCDYE